MEKSPEFIALFFCGLTGPGSDEPGGELIPLGSIHRPTTEPRQQAPREGQVEPGSPARRWYFWAARRDDLRHRASL